MRTRSELVLGMVVTGSLLWTARPAFGQTPNPNSKLCFKNFIGVPGFSQPPKIDGCLRGCSYPGDAPAVHDDFAWQNAFEFVANPINAPGPPTGDVVVQGVYDPSGPGNIDLSFDVKNDTRLDDNDAVVIALKGSVAGSPGDYGLLVIYPFLNHAGTAYNGPIGGAVGQVQFFSGTQSGANVTWPATFASNPSWVTAFVNSGGSGTSWSWTVEVQIQRGATGITVNPAGFNLFFDVIRIFDQGGLQGLDMPWPPAATVGTVASSPPTPTIDQWGIASLNSGVCGGVFFAASDIATNQLNPSLISTTTPNRFSVALKNTLIDTRPGANQNKPVAAPAVTAKFRIANFGLPSDLAWAAIPDANDVSNTADVPAATTTPANSTVPPGTIAAPGTVTLTTKAPGWIPDPTWVTAHSMHQCILTELSSPNSDVLFVNKGNYRNMDYGHNPGFSPVAAIDGRWGPPPAGRSTHTIDLLYKLAFQFAFGDGSVEGIPLGTLTAQISLVFSGYRHTGRFVTLRNSKVEIVNPIGSFGYVVQHALSLDVAKSFNQRHEQQTKAAFSVAGPAGNNWARVNQMLVNDADKPAPTDWKIAFPGLNSVEGTGGQMLRIEVPNNTVSTLTGTVAYNLEAGCLGGCCCSRSSSAVNTTPTKAASLGMCVLVGVVVFRRRKRP